MISLLPVTFCTLLDILSSICAIVSRSVVEGKVVFAVIICLFRFFFVPLQKIKRVIIKILIQKEPGCKVTKKATGTMIFFPCFSRNKGDLTLFKVTEVTV